MKRIERGPAIDCLLELFASYSEPSQILAAYLRRPVAGSSLHRTVEQLAMGRFAGWKPQRTLILARAATMLRWLNSGDAGARNPYHVLGLSLTAGQTDLVDRYRALSKQVHPDRHSAEKVAYWARRQQEINDAYEALSDPGTRAQWQARLQQRAQLLRRLWEIEHRR